ncbi:uncharacterized protein [Gossypium hirsutum]|uniref:Tf2-1-like SH3-like domain-containing protein n=1 Tax=Gossypium hirsutum TaxID=3635 RepID=A0A1U8PBD9_GOSHI|nr:uncharacterized protein LOC107956416 [Gossypium hirsutum]
MGERRVLGPELVSKTEDKVRLIQDRLEAASDRQKSYVDLKRREIEYLVKDFVFLKVSLWKKILRLCEIISGNVSYPVPASNTGRVLQVAHQLELPPELDCIHDVFHVSMLRQYRSDPSDVVSIEEIEVTPDLTFEEDTVQILDRDVKVTHSLRRIGAADPSVTTFSNWF